MGRLHRMVAVLWLAFTVLFCVMAFFHWRLSTENAPDFVVATRPGAGFGSVQILGADIDKPLRDFTANFNEYVHVQNATSHRENFLAMWGYLAAAMTSIVSFLLEMVAIREIDTKISQSGAADT